MKLWLVLFCLISNLNGESLFQFTAGSRPVNFSGNLAYCISKKPCHISSDRPYLGDGTPSIVAGSSLFLNGIKIGGGDCWSPSWSRDGTKLAYFSNLDGGPNLWIYDTVARKLNNIIILSDGYEPPVWNRDLVYISSHQLLAIDCETGMVKASWKNAKNPKISSSGDYLAYMTNIRYADNPTYYQYDLAIAPADGSGQPVIVSTNLECEDLHKPSYVWHPSQDKLAFVNGSELYEGLFEPRKVCDGVFRFPLLYSENSVIVGSKPFKGENGDEPGAIKLLGNHTFEVHLDDYFFNQVVEVSDNGFTLLIDHKITDEAMLILFEKDSETVLWSGLAHVSITGKNQNSFYALYEDLETPADIYLLPEKRRITHIEPFWDDISIPEISYKSRTTILFPKREPPAAGWPALVLVYPGLDFSRNRKMFMGGYLIPVFNYIFLDKGYALILPDLTIGPEGVAGQPIQETSLKLMEQIENLDPRIDRKRLGLAGHSYGGYGTAAILTQTDQFKAGVALAGCYDLGSVYGDSGLDGFQWAEKGQGRMGGPPWDNWTRYLENSPYYLADRIQTPLLLIHGEEDATCSVLESYKMFNALMRLKKDVQMATYPSEGHVLRNWKSLNSTHAIDTILDFLNQRL